MLDPLDPTFFFALFGDNEDVACPYCQAELTVSSDKASVGDESFQCNECQGVFIINWDEEQVYYDTLDSINVRFLNGRVRGSI